MYEITKAQVLYISLVADPLPGHELQEVSGD